MTLQTAGNITTPSAHLVGNAFVEQYYHILHTSPELVYRFYQDSSVLSRPDSNGVMTSVSTMQDEPFQELQPHNPDNPTTRSSFDLATHCGINEKILSLNFKDYKAEIKTADAQKSYNEGVTVLVTGCLTDKDNLRRKFAQSFFLAPQDIGYFVLNDVFRYLEDNETLENHSDSIPTFPSSVPDQDSSRAADPSAPDPTTPVVEDSRIVVEKVNDTVDHDKQTADREAVVEPQSYSNGNDVPVVIESASPSVPEDAPKKSYASIVKVAKGSSYPTKVYQPTNTAKMAPKRTEYQLIMSSAPSSEPEALAQSSNIPENSDVQEEVEGHSIYVQNFPFDVTVAQLETEFKKFGPIKEDGIQVRYNKQQGYCFGFVEFLSQSSMDNAVQAAPVTIGGRQAIVEIKRAAGRPGSGRGRFPSFGRIWYRSDSFRGRGNTGGGRGFGRNDFGGWGEFSGRGRSSSGRGDGHQLGRGRGGGRSSGAKQNVNSA